MTISLQHTPIRLDDNLCHRPSPTDGIRAGFQHRELTVHLLVSIVLFSLTAVNIPSQQGMEYRRERIRMRGQRDPGGSVRREDPGDLSGEAEKGG
jgi:hypothetical protein